MKYSNRSLIAFSAMLLGLIFFVDSLTPHGWADFIFYFLPLVVLIFTRNSALPIIAASFITVFMIVGYFFSPDGAPTLLAVVNRFYALVSMWIVAFIIRSTIHARNEASRQTWLVTGRSLVADSIRGELTVAGVVQKSVTALSKYLDAQVAALYILEPFRKELQFCSGFAVPESLKQNPKTFEFGQGAIGQVAVDQKLLRLENPSSQTALKVTSAFNEIQPAYTLIAPIHSNNELNGVLEMGFLKAPDEATDELLQNISEVISIAIRTAQTRERLRELLDETQRQAEELQAQQEELRVTNEELEQQSRALQESQVRLENNQAELEQSNQQLEEQMQELERQKQIMDEKNDHLLRTQDELEKHRDELAQSTRYKSEFLANMSHELRTPLNSSLILAKLLKENKEKNLNEEQIRFAETIYAAGNDLLNLINDILDLSKIEAGKLEVRPERVLTTSLVSSLEKYFQPIADQKKLAFKIEVDSLAAPELLTDRQRLEQILKNFLSNAFKFTDKGEVRLSVRSVDQKMQFEVADTGIGIGADQQRIIFEAFQQADGTVNRKYGGTGLGLSISRELTALLGGQITLQSQSGVGSRFTLEMPLSYKKPNDSTIPQRSESPSTPTKVVRSLIEAPAVETSAVKPRLPLPFQDDRGKLSKKKRVLIIEDDHSFARILFDLAHEMGFDAIIGTDAAEGLNLAQDFVPQAVLLDVHLPDHSGLSVLDQLKRSAKTRHIPVHVISGHDFSRAALHMGAAGYHLKPVAREQLVKAFEELESRMNSLKRVLIVEDNEMQRTSMEALIADKDAEIVSVGSAEEALDQLKSRKFDCMIMDLTLPGMSGIELLETIAGLDSTFSNLPVIVYTGRDLTTAEELQLKKYSDSIIVKGARSPERLLSEVTLFLHRVESDLPLDRQKMLFELRNREKTLENKKILVVDDDVRNIFALTSLLEQQGAKVEIARHGKEALQKLSAVSDIDLVLMDIMMPEMDGFEATRKIREQPSFAKLPVIAVTAKAMQDDQEKCLQAGANDYLSKPIDSDKLLSLIRVWLPTRGK